MFRHTPGLETPGASQSSGLVDGWAYALASVGWVGVDLFFVLSGFLISGLLFKEYDRDGSINLSRFWIRRGLKIWPAYFVAYGSVVVYGLVKGLWRHSASALEQLEQALPNVVFVQNYFPEDIRWAHSWSLAVEEHFYLALPILLVALMRWNKNRNKITGPGTAFCGLALCGVGIAVFSLGARIAVAVAGKPWGDAYYPTHLRMDSLFFGVLLGYTSRYKPDRLLVVARYLPALALAALGAFALPLAWPIETSPWMISIGFTLLYLGFGGLVALASVHPNFGRHGAGMFRWTTGALAFMGVYSYTVYLAHSVVLDLPGVGRVYTFARAWLPETVWSDVFLFGVLSIVGGVVLSHLVERPALRWRERLFRAAPRGESVLTAKKEGVALEGIR